MRGMAVSLGVAILGVALLVGSSDGQGGGEPKKTKDGKITGTLPQGWKELNLTAVQKEKVYELNAKYKSKIDALVEQEKALQQELIAERVKVLTSEQKEMLQKRAVGESTKKASKDDAPKKAPKDDKK